MKTIFYCFLLLAFTLSYSTHLNGQTKPSTEFTVEDSFQKEKKNILKLNLLAVSLLENLEISYERALSPKQSIEARVGLIGIGLINHEYLTIEDENGNDKKRPVVNNGLFFSGGYKFFINDSNYFNKKRKSNILRGLYLQPELIAGFYSRNKTIRLAPNYNSRLKKEKVNYQAALLNIGFQGIFKNKIVFELFAGLGIGNDNLPELNDPWLYFGEFHRGIYKTTTGVSTAGKLGIRLGLLF